ncbi:MAG: glycine--tRNA ligase subunit beta [Thermodesulfobacteriota bacterium]
MSEFVIEVGTEEMPARFLPNLEKGFRKFFQDNLSAENIEYSEISAFTTPRRLVVCISNISPLQEEKQEIIMGPPVNVAYDGDWQLTRAGSGFLQKQGVGQEDLFTKQTEKGNYLAATRTVGGNRTKVLMSDICVAAISNLNFPKKMRWERSGFNFGRPIRWIMCIFDREVVPFQIASLQSDRYTWGHRVMGAGPWKIEEAGQYLDLIRNQGGIVLDSGERKRMIRENGDRLAQGVQGKVVWDTGLLGEVADLTEYPKPVLGEIDPKYMDLPKEVLITSMESHQKSFGIEDTQGNLLPYFLCCLNLEPADLDLVRKGWERVLKARLEDAWFFWETDSKSSLQKWIEELNKVVFMGPLGSMGDKAVRLQWMARYLSEKIAPEEKSDVERAAFFSKADLVSEMVGEFSDLQGIMGGIYARQKGESEKVGKAIYEHYLPLGQDSSVPETLGGAILSIVDKADNLYGCFGLNMIPTGAQDPYALRRQALGIVRTALEHGLRFSLQELFSKTHEYYADVEWQLSSSDTWSALEEFFGQRLKAYFTQQGYSTRLVDAALGAGMDDIWTMYRKLQALYSFSQQEDFEHAVLTFKRADNIIRKQGDSAPGPLDKKVDFDRLSSGPEYQLAEHIQELVPKWEELWENEQFDELFALLRELRPVVDAFFDNVMVMTDDPELRQNRLNILKSLVDRLSLLADFNALQI